MNLKTLSLAGLAAAVLALPAFAGDIAIEDPYARASTMMSKSGAAFMTIVNAGAADDRLVAATSDVADKVELHTHKEDANGVMRMVEVEEGFPVPAGGQRELKRGGDHVMFLGLTRPLEQGDMVKMTLTFEQAGEMEIEVPVDLTRDPMMKPGTMGGQMKMGN
ncbi:copper chaperone PCu(A)C [Rhodovulum sp. P5]|uniref:copper chaperone PCu(A)C n=1 Tax=Rhodovulum sp. P5 TaxID=1564506 RepID=UPI0009DB3CAC|nr:copper chaperone PCu(A)C [Rhodovulum sp. P5]